eukprot:CAMPEP_0196585868 /NCGR_PEP_ID=MMETSP1081-20130531/52354_1 /TAXON_ID=36882 /ORGANISM="Pyramimonas amylifera, Strain CCMP720" /LENGTH=391 /DNA_ID=CAMNT_0041907561 /DNA_START=316 /DNA_END=1488 /DNA_ORIENTATION=+
MKLMGVVDFSNIHLLWSLPVNICLSILIGSALGFTSAKLFRAPKELVGMLSAVTALGNVGNLPLVLVATLGKGDSPFGYNVADLGIAYVSFGIWVASIFQFSISYYLLAPASNSPSSSPPLLSPPLPSPSQLPHSTHPQVAPHSQASSNGFFSMNSLANSSANSVPATADEMQQAKSSDMMTALLDDPESKSDREDGLGSYHVAVMCAPQDSGKNPSCFDVLHRGFLAVKNFQWSMIFTFPIKCMFTAIGFGLIPPIKGLFFGAHAPLEIVKDTLDCMGEAMIPCMMAVLGANLSKGPPACKLPFINVAAVVVCRLIIAPCIGVPIVVAAVKYGIVKPPDQLFVFVLLLQHCMPTAINMHTVATLHQNGVAEVTTALFWQYLLSLITLPLW